MAAFCASIRRVVVRLSGTAEKLSASETTRHPHKEYPVNQPPYPSGTLARGTNPTRRDLLKLGALSVLAQAWLAGCGGSDAPLSYDATIADARAAILKAMADSDTPSVSVALIERDRLVWAEAFGSLDKAAGTAVSTETLFCIGSCSKVLATMAVMVLVDRGLVRLDEPLVTYLPGFRMASPEYTQVTVRMLLNHSSGFPGFDPRGSIDSAPNPQYAAQVLQTLAQVRLKHAPGEMSVYCNDGFTVVELLVQAITGTSYPQFVTQAILAPLGMVRSRYATERFAAGSYAPAYDGDTPLPQEFANLYGSGGLYTTPTEMALLARALLNQGTLEGQRLLSAEAIAEMARNQTTGQPLRPVAMADGYGLGWDGVRQDGLAAAGITAWHKNGGTLAYGSDFYVLPGEGLALLITGTSTTYRPGALAERILLRALVERGRLAAMPQKLAATPSAALTASDAQRAQMTGVYASGDSIYQLQPQADGTMAMAQYDAGAWADSPTVLKLRGDGRFSSDAAPLQSYQAVQAQGQRYLTLRTPNGMGHYLFEMPYLQQLEAKAPLSAAWRARLGRRWLAVNQPAESLLLQYGGPTLTLSDVPGLSGYIVTNAEAIGKQNQMADASTSDSLALMCLKLPFALGRDLDDVVILPRAGEEWIRVGSSVFCPEDSVAPLAVGASSIQIGVEGHAEWRAIAASATEQTITLTGAAAWSLYDGEFNLLASGDATRQPQLPASADQSYLLVYGAANASIGVTLS